MQSIADNLKQVNDRIASAAAKAGRDPSEITLVAVSKMKPAETIREAYEAGQRAFGENYAQHLAQKAAELADLDIRWHFIGHLQTNKAKLVAPVAHCIETVDSLKLAQALDRRAEKPIDVLIEINIGAEDSKAGVTEDGLPELIRGLEGCEKLTLTGLMIIPPFGDDPEASRPHFKNIRETMTRINDLGILEKPLTELSMGMSHDFEVAVEEGATIVRVGTAIFGERS